MQANGTFEEGPERETSTAEIMPSLPRVEISPVRALVIFLTAVVILLIIWLPVLRVPGIPPGMAPGAAAALRRALGDDALGRVTQVISSGNQPSTVSGRTHMISGFAHGVPYGLAFDLSIPPFDDANADVRRLRLQGIAAWRRGPDSPGGGETLAPHIHCVWAGAPTDNPDNREQISSFIHGYRGLSGLGITHDHWSDPTIQSDERDHVRLVYESVNGHGSLDAVAPYEERHRGVRQASGQDGPDDGM